MKAALIVNGRAGALSAVAAPRAALEAALREAGFDLVASAEEGASLDVQWAATDASAAEIVFVAGGDGTLRDAAERLLKTGRIFAPLPGGTMNRVCRRLGLPPDPIMAARGYRAGAVVALDVATANGEVFLYQSIIGVPTRLMRFREMQRGAGMRGWWPLLRALTRELFRPSSRAIALHVAPGRRARGHAAVVTMPEPGGTASLTLHLVRPPHGVARFRQVLRWFRGRLGEDPDIASREGARLVLHGRATWLRLSLDGETRLSPSPLRFRLHRGALRLLAPPAAG
ncbi:MAG: putative diacylglycerol kinase related protein [Rubritepida sp.]|nr:putative diacylglycerol kinase related protein [Rubritepida sp.]